MQNILVTRKGRNGPVPCRLFFILAREAPLGVIFRRGPSKWVQLIKWDMSRDTFEPGQWFHGKIYARRSDLSPSGALLIYFAQKITGKTINDPEYTYAWTAISKPPYLTALALWPKGDCWHGGGSFKDERTVWLNHKPAVAKPHPRHKPQGLKVIPNPDACGEDDPVFSIRLARDGWKLEQEWHLELKNLSYRTLQPEIWSKVNPHIGIQIRLTRSISRVDYTEEFALTSEKGPLNIPILRADWVDWDTGGRLVFGQDGKLFASKVDELGRLNAIEIADFNSSRPEPIKTPQWARTW